MSLRVYTLSGGQLCLDGCEPRTIWQLKGLIKERLGVARRLQRIFDGTCELANNYTLLSRADSALTVAVANDRECRVCEHVSRRFCSGCFSACYCSEQCQMKDWIVHRPQCERQHRQHRQPLIVVSARAFKPDFAAFPAWFISVQCQSARSLRLRTTQLHCWNAILKLLCIAFTT